MSEEKKQLNEEQLEKVSGGDDGDPNKECADTPEGVTPLYSVGQYVEVYNSSIHIRTKRSQITSIRIGLYRAGGGYARGYEDKYVPYYTVHVIEDNEDREVLSHDIQS